MTQADAFGMSPEDFEALRRAKHTLENPGLVARLSGLLGTPIERLMTNLPKRWSDRINKAVGRSLMAALKTALTTIERRAKPKNNRVHRVLVGGTGAAGGFFGMPALTIELPVSTALMLRSIADIARSEGENLSTADAQLACVEVFAFGGKSESDDPTESAYFAIRTALAAALAQAPTHFGARGAVKAGAPVLVRFIAQVSSRFGVVVTEKVAAQAVPIVGAAGGAAINLLFVKHFQDMAHGHFTVRRLERQYGPGVVRRAYEEL